MDSINVQKVIETNVTVWQRVDGILKIASIYSLQDIFRENIKISYSEEMIKYELEIQKTFFKELDHFQMKFEESGIVKNDSELNFLKIKAYSYHGFYISDPQFKFLRFDFEPFKKLHAPIHINTPVIWGDHLTYPDTTNLDISKISPEIALKIFNRYAKNENDYPTNAVTNAEYVSIMEGR